jgi:uncharacterized protein YlxW (UPF0749 family)
LIAGFVTQVGIVEIAILFAAIGYVVQLVLDALGVSRSSRTLRSENEDLVRRNKELDDAVLRLKSELSRLESELAGLRTQVSDLSQRDQGAVLRVIEDHERTAGIRHERMVGVLTEIRDAVKSA